MTTRIKNQEHWQPPLEQLQTVLLKQCELIKNGKIQDAQKLTQQTSTLVTKIVPPPVPLRPQWARQYKQVHQLYQKLTLMLETQKAALKTQQQKIGSGKKTMRAYHSKI